MPQAVIHPPEMASGTDDRIDAQQQLPTSAVQGFAPLPSYRELQPSDHEPRTLAAYGFDSASWEDLKADFLKKAEEWKNKAKQLRDQTRTLLQQAQAARVLNASKAIEHRLHVTAASSRDRADMAKMNPQNAQRRAEASGSSSDRAAAKQALAEQKAAEIEAVNNHVLAGNSSSYNHNFDQAVIDYTEALLLLDKETQSRQWADVQWMLGVTYRKIALHCSSDEIAALYLERSDQAFKDGQSVYAPKNGAGEWSPKDRTEWIKFQLKLKPHWSS